ncbi:hypothetical protein [uncultured Nostoc sp.]|uniref:hypothetical protein n=1 Tax=uncultured Nostoc sp. TaxID=340711 RepID=UPI0035C9B25D
MLLYLINLQYAVIKEVNPKATGFYCQQYCPKILFLLRHPAAVALSFARQGWLKARDTQVDTGDPDASVWEKFGYAYGSTMKRALDIIQNGCEPKIILYKNVALDPKEQFRQLFQSLEFDIPKNYEEMMHDYCYSEKLVKNNHQTRRISKDMIYKWCEQLSNQEIALIKNGFTISGLDLSSNEIDWLPSNNQ